MGPKVPSHRPCPTARSPFYGFTEGFLSFSNFRYPSPEQSKTFIGSHTMPSRSSSAEGGSSPLKAGASETSRASPPAYNDSITNSFSRLGIHASSHPHLLWSTAQCRAWIVCVCVTYLSMPLDQAESCASTFDGFGPSLYAMPKSSWEERLGGEHRGHSVYNLLKFIGLTSDETITGIPEDFMFRHWASKHSEVGLLQNLWRRVFRE